MSSPLLALFLFAFSLESLSVSAKCKEWPPSIILITRIKKSNYTPLLVSIYVLWFYDHIQAPGQGVSKVPEVFYIHFHAPHFWYLCCRLPGNSLSNSRDSLQGLCLGSCQNSKKDEYFNQLPISSLFFLPYGKVHQPA